VTPFRVARVPVHFATHSPALGFTSSISLRAGGSAHTKCAHAKLGGAALSISIYFANVARS